MNEKAWYWVAAGVFALGLSNSLAERQIGWARAMPDQLQEAADQFTASASDQAMRFLDVANRLSNRDELGMARAEVALDRVQTRVACLRSVVAERQAATARIEAEKVKVISIGNLPSVRKFSCPKSSTAVTTVRQMPAPDTI